MKNPTKASLPGALLALIAIALVACIGFLIATMVAHAANPVYRPEWATCPGGWHASGAFCVDNGGDSVEALENPTRRTCPGGWHASGSYCVPNSANAPRAVKNPNGKTCPAGWRASGNGFCIR